MVLNQYRKEKLPKSSIKFYATKIQKQEENSWNKMHVKEEKNSKPDFDVEIRMGRAGRPAIEDEGFFL